MLYECLVIDNADFFKKGTIRVRLKREVGDPSMMKDISSNPMKSINEYGEQRYDQYGKEEKEFKYKDRDVMLMTNIGGAFDYGFFLLPQPNTWGIVSELGSYDESLTTPRFVWLGALSMFNNLTKSINIPSDNLEKSNGCNRGEVNLSEPFSGLVFKQKETHISNSAQDIKEESMETLDWRQRPTQNMVVMNGEKIYIVHNNYDEEGNPTGVSQININKNSIDLIGTNDKDESISQLRIGTNGSFGLTSRNDKDGISNMIEANSNSVSITHNEKNNNIGILMGDDFNGKPVFSLNFKSEENTTATEIKMDSKNGMTINSSSNISINPGQNGTVTLGTGENYILTSPSPGTWNYDNHTVTAVKNAKA